jgi:hypothetical protein
LVDNVQEGLVVVGKQHQGGVLLIDGGIGKRNVKKKQQQQRRRKWRRIERMQKSP